jgi:P27 family predicted phage terminase small subunit
LKIAAGNPGKRPLNEQEPKPEASAGEPPSWLSSDAREIWFRLAAPMTKCGLVTRVDELALARYCTLLAMWIKATEAVQKAKSSAYTIKNKSGQIVGHRELPQMAELRRLGPQLTQLEREFGLTPASRTRVKAERGAAIESDPDALDRFFLGSGRTARPGA